MNDPTIGCCVAPDTPAFEALLLLHAICTITVFDILKKKLSSDGKRHSSKNGRKLKNVICNLYLLYSVH